MTEAFVSALLVLAGGLCAIAGYTLGARHERRTLAAEIGRMPPVEPDVDGFGDPTPRRDQRPN